MAITALSMMSRAARLIRVKGVDENLTAQEAADGLYALNSMLDAWSIEKLMVYQVQQSTHSWASGNATRTIGSGGDFSTTRPIHIEYEGNFFRSSDGVDYPVVTLSRERFDLKTFKSTSGIPEELFFDGGFPLRTLYAYPYPSSTMTLYLSTWKPLQQFTSLTTTISLPAGYQAAIEANLAVWMAPEYGAAAVAAANDIRKDAERLKASIKNVNKPDMTAQVDVPGVGSPARIEQG